MTDEKKMTYLWEGLGRDFPTGVAELIDQAELDFLEEVQERCPRLADSMAVVTYLDLTVNGVPEMRNEHFADRHRVVLEAIASVPGSLCSLRATATVYEQA